MSDFTIRSESVDVEQIMKQIRARILEKRGADYTDDQIRELATVRLEKFLDSKNLRSDLLEQFRKSRPAVHTDPPKIEPPYAFDDRTLFASHRGPLRLIRRLLMPVLKLFFNPNVLNQVLHSQSQFNVDLLKRESRRKIEFDRSRAEWNTLYYEVLHNLVLETTRMGIEVQNLRMRVESLSSRLDFSERRVRALEGVVQYRPEAVRAPERRDSAEADQPATGGPQQGSMEGFVPAAQQQAEGSRRRRRRRRGRRGQGAPGAQGAMGAQAAGAQGANAPGAEDTEGFDDGPDEDGPEEMEAADGFDVSASARDESDELRRDKPEPADTSDELDSPSTLDENKVPEPPGGSSDDDLQ
jgi:hypothetical protein